MTAASLWCLPVIYYLCRLAYHGCATPSLWVTVQGSSLFGGIAPWSVILGCLLRPFTPRHTQCSDLFKELFGGSPYMPLNGALYQTKGVSH